LRSDLVLFFFDSQRRIARTSRAAMDSDSPNLDEFPYGAVALPAADRNGCAVVVVTQPGVATRRDVLILEVPARLAATVIGNVHRSSHEAIQGTARFRVEMNRRHGATPELTTSCAVIRFAMGMTAGQELDGQVRKLLASVCYSIRADDRPGWFEYGSDAFADAEFRHGFPDIATREQGRRGIRGPSILAMGLQPPIDPRLSRPVRTSVLVSGERVIYELHVGTFTHAGTFEAAAEKLEYLRDLGISTVQLMPIDIGTGQPGWTYDQTRTGAVDSECYGGAAGLIRFVERAHALGLEVIVDKQYNHRGPEQDSRAEIIPGMFDRATIWGAGTSGPEAPRYVQIEKVIGEEIAYWVSQFGIDGLRLDATNRLPWELHQAIADFGDQIGEATGKQLYFVSEYAECESPKGRRTPTGHQYTDQVGRYLMKLLKLSRARHVVELHADQGSLMRPMLKAARRGWWYPDVPEVDGGLSGIERVTALLWHHDWIGNRFGGERLQHLCSFDLFKTMTVWFALGQWTPLVFMGTERWVKTPWWFFTGHQDANVSNDTSAFYSLVDGVPVLSGGRFLEFAEEAREAGLEDPLAFSSDGTLAGIDWARFRNQRDRHGRLYMDHAQIGTFQESVIDWTTRDSRQEATEGLFRALFTCRTDDRIKESDPHHVQYKGWSGSEYVFALRRRNAQGEELCALFNLGRHPVTLRVISRGVEAERCGTGYIVEAREGRAEVEWTGSGMYTLWLDTNAECYGGPGHRVRHEFTVSADNSEPVVLGAETALVYSRTKSP